jgi:hypothetical protein
MLDTGYRRGGVLKLYKVIIVKLGLAIIIILSCSNAKENYQRLESFQSEKEQLVMKDSDFNTKIQICNEVIDSIVAFQAIDKKNQWAQNTRKAIAFWDSLKVTIEISKDYSRIDKFQTEKEQLLQQTYGYDIKSQACNEVMDSIKAFQSRDVNGVRSQQSGNVLNLWKSRIANIERDNAFDNMLRTEQTSENALGMTSDYDIKIRCCNEAVAAIKHFLSNYNQDKTLPELNTAISSWETRKSTLLQEINSLYERAYELNESNTAAAANRRHLWSTIDKMTLDSRDKRKEGDKIIVTSSYSIRMIGILLKTNIFNLRITTLSEISMSNKTVNLIGRPIVEE